MAAIDSSHNAVVAAWSMSTSSLQSVGLTPECYGSGRSPEQREPEHRPGSVRRTGYRYRPRPLPTSSALAHSTAIRAVRDTSQTAQRGIAPGPLSGSVPAFFWELISLPTAVNVRATRPKLATAPRRSRTPDTL